MKMLAVIVVTILFLGCSTLPFSIETPDGLKIKGRWNSLLTDEAFHAEMDTSGTVYIYFNRGADAGSMEMMKFVAELAVGSVATE